MAASDPDRGDPSSARESAVGSPAATYQPRIPAALGAVALLLVLGLGYVESHHKAAQDAILAEQRELLAVKTVLLEAEREILLARNEESTLLLLGGEAPISAFRERLRDAKQDLRELDKRSASQVSEALAVASQTVARYEKAVEQSIVILSRLGKAGSAGLLDRLHDTESKLSALFARLGRSRPSLAFADLRVRQKDFSFTLNIAHAESMLNDTDALTADLAKLPASALRTDLLSTLAAFRETVFQAMSGVLELELATSQSSLRFGRVSPEVRTVEQQLDELISAASSELQMQRRASRLQTAIVMAGVFLAVLISMLFEARRARAWITLESRLREAQKLESLSVLTGGIAHDFNNLLTGVLGRAKLASAALRPGSPAHGHLSAIETAARRAAELVKEMLAYAGEARFLPVPCKLEDLVAEMARLLETTISPKVDLVLSSSEDLPAVEIDATQLRQVIMNLVINASDAIGDRAGTIEAHTGLLERKRSDPSGFAGGGRLPAGTYVYLEVRDNGSGMDRETRRRLFEPFFSTKRKGRGLGMAAVLGIVHAHRGAIVVESEVGRGSTFRVLLPASDLPVEAAKQKSAFDFASRQGRGTILVVEDDALTREFVCSCLMVNGFEALVAEDGHKALHLFSKYADEIRAVLLDMSMPGLDGEETFRKLRGIRRNVKVILCTGHPEEKVVARFEGLAGFLEKPFDPDTLTEKIFRALDVSNDDRQVRERAG